VKFDARGYPLPVPPPVASSTHNSPPMVGSPSGGNGSRTRNNGTLSDKASSDRSSRVSERSDSGGNSSERDGRRNDKGPGRHRGRDQHNRHNKAEAEFPLDTQYDSSGSSSGRSDSSSVGGKSGNVKRIRDARAFSRNQSVAQGARRVRESPYAQPDPRNPNRHGSRRY
jgi:hypothetical protein